MRAGRRLQNMASGTVHDLRYEHGRARTKSTVRLFLLVLLVLTVEIVTLTIQTSALV